MTKVSIHTDYEFGGTVQPVFPTPLYFNYLVQNNFKAHW